MEVQTDRPAMTMWQLIKYNKIMPSRVARFCCRVLKERGGSNRVVVTGVRAQESIRRSKRKMNEVCYKDPTKRYLHVIVDWSTEDVWQFIRENNIEYCKLYDEGFKRLGCVLCPLKSQKEREKDMTLYPRIVGAYRRAAIRAYEARERPSKGFMSGEDMFNWWISCKNVNDWLQSNNPAFWEEILKEQEKFEKELEQDTSF